MSGDTFTNTGTAGVMGTMQGGQVTQNIGGSAVDFAKLASELEKLHLSLQGAAAVDPTVAPAAEAVAAAQAAAKSEDEKGVLSSLAKIGGKGLKMALDVGQNIAVDVAVKFLKQAVGLGA